MTTHLISKSGVFAIVLLSFSGAAPLANAQPHYSVNVVGYVDANFVAGSNLMANPLNAGDNAISNVLKSVPEGSIYLAWSQAVPGFASTNQFSDDQGWSDPTARLERRDAGFLWLPAPTAVSFVGEPWPATCIQYMPGFTVSGVLPRLACIFCPTEDCLLNLPEFAQVIRWDRERQRFDTAEYSVDSGWQPAEPTLDPDEAALIFNPSPTSLNARSPGSPFVGSVQLLNAGRMGTNLTFEFSSIAGIEYRVQRATGESPDHWRTILTNTTTSSGAYNRVSVPMQEAKGFFRLHALRLTNPRRTGSEFRFEFFAEDGVSYQVSRTPSLATPNWQFLGSVTGTGAATNFVDSSAFHPVAYYRVSE